MIKLFRRGVPATDEVGKASRRYESAHDDLRAALHRLLTERNGTAAEPQEVEG